MSTTLPITISVIAASLVVGSAWLGRYLEQRKQRQYARKLSRYADDIIQHGWVDPNAKTIELTPEMLRALPRSR